MHFNDRLFKPDNFSDTYGGIYENKKSDSSVDVLRFGQLFLPV
jgi:hypothetical protein